MRFDNPSGCWEVTFKFEQTEEGEDTKTLKEMPFVFRKELVLTIKCHKDEKVIKAEDRQKPMYTELDPELNKEMEDK